MRFINTLRAVAAYEAVKGLLVLLTGFGLLAFIHRDLDQFADQVVAHFHLNPAGRVPRLFLGASADLTDTRLWLLAAMTMGYALVRFVEAYGLWQGRRWAEWLAALSAGIYLPFEIYELSKSATWILISAFVTNILVIVVMIAALRRSRVGLSA